MPEGITVNKRSAVFMDLGILEYKRALELQIKTLEARIDKSLSRDRVFFVEHPPVFTLGKRGGEENLTVSREFLASRGIDLVQTDRGGNITYHGPGQAVLYPIVNLEEKRMGVKDFVWGLEEVMKQTALEFNIKAGRDTLNHGLWVGNAKIGSVGLCIKKGINFHGLAMNICPDLEPFSWMNPCGLSHISVTSVRNELQKAGKDSSGPAINQVKAAFKKHFAAILNYDMSESHES
nr:lipoyl(octanoyl) transferase LipB [Desulfobacula sp.]